MPRVILTERFDWRIPGKRAVMSWPPGEHLLTTPQATEAKRRGIARTPPTQVVRDDAN
jgi:hypothetical protein